MAEPAAPLEDFYSALIFLADEAFNRNNESSLGMVAMWNNNNLANELLNF